ncbi:cleavage polyadenylation factor subunit CLP1 [Lachancea thermotolerans CBS 6340]|uniref:Polynucleotide 5'-hydroxyl-kinase GRC3 n=1 Tax=Lachancea thermotolerans (strain ATCC 56472 / CBS 6340 / NRRL Y-8284) TaxID=559295 RepID=C5DF21_LACTC|nr:KLTH0D11594p [Lachancea thermotolerans CBS 6340]CAR22776.1 KLTH0D11594p [Lachancea thermotolerans CBS 6340]
MASLPGLNDSLHPADLGVDLNEPKHVSITAGSEWRVDVPQESKLTIKVHSGVAEIFGTELASDVPYVFQGTKFAVYAVEDAEFEWTSPELTSHSISSDTNMKFIYNVHFALEKLRVSSFEGPRVLIVGESCTGKTSLAKTLCAYAIKFKAHQPMMVNLNPQECIYSPPGCLTATPISDVIDVSSSTWGQSMTSGATKLHNKQPIVKSFGLEQISENKERYVSTFQQLANAVRGRVQNDSTVRRSGLIIDTPPLGQLSDDFSELKEIIYQFKVNAVVVCAKDDTLALKLNEHLPVETLAIVRLPTSSGVVQTDDVYKRALQRNAIREYFYGDFNTVLSPYTIGVDSDMITVWQPKSVLVQSDSQDDLLPVEINASNLQHALVAISYASRRSSSEEVSASPILGFALIMDVNDTKRKLRVLLPVPGLLPDKAMILTAYRYLE